MQVLQKKTRLFLMLLIFLPGWGKAQTGPKEFGDVSREELELKTYEKDTSAAALILFDKAYLEVDHFSTRGWTLKRHIRVKILKQEAVQDWSKNVRLSRTIDLKKVEGASYNLENGEIVSSKLTKEEVYKTKQNKYTNKTSFALPNVKEGSVIEYVYTEKSGRLYSPRWTFQHTSPTLWSEYSFFFPVSGLEPHIRGPFQIVQEETKYDGQFQKWVLKDIPAFKKEPLMPDVNAYLAAIEFSSKKRSWLDVYNHFILAESFSGIVQKHDYLQKEVDVITAGITDPKEKVKAVSDYIKQNIQWNGVKDNYSDSPKEVFERKKGTSGDINLIFASMLKKAGLKVNLLLLSTRDNGFILEDYPTPGQFNYVVCELMLNNERLLFDATEKFLPFDMLPAHCFNHKGFLVSSEQYGWIGMEPKRHHKVSVEADLTLMESGEVGGEVKLLMSDYAAFQIREEQVSEEGDDEKYVNKVLKKDLWDVKLLEKQHIENIEKPVLEKYELNSRQNAIVANDRIYLNPHLFLRVEQNPFKMQERVYPVDFDMLEDKTVLTKIKVPEGFVVEELPESAALVLQGNALKFISSVSHSGNQIIVMSKLQVNKTLFQPFEYLELKEMYDRIIAKQSESVVLKRK